MSQITKVAVLGSGTMGHGIAQLSAMAGYQVALRDVERRFLDSAMEKIRWSLSKLVKKQKITDSELEQIIDRIKPVTDLEECLKAADLLIEAVPEDINLKRKVYSEIDRYAESTTIYASNTSTLPITELAELTTRARRFIGLHFFNPPQLMQLVEVIPGKETDQAVTDFAMKFVERLHKDPILCRKDVVGFIVNRVFIPLVHEAAHCEERDGASVVSIDSAVKDRMAFPMGIFELADYTGIDVIHKATVEMLSRDNRVVNPHPKIKQLFDQGKYGQKSGNGFYEYKDGMYERVNIAQNESKDYDPIKLVAVAANNAAWLISNSVCDRQDLEKALKLGMGLKVELFATVEQFGLPRVIDTLLELSAKYGDFYKPDQYLLSLRTKA